MLGRIQNKLIHRNTVGKQNIIGKKQIHNSHQRKEISPRKMTINLATVASIEIRYLKKKSN